MAFSLYAIAIEHGIHTFLPNVAMCYVSSVTGVFCDKTAEAQHHAVFTEQRLGARDSGG